MKIEILPQNLSEDKAERYQEMLKVIFSVIEGEDDMIANMANITAVIKDYFSFFWIGFYMVKGEQLVLAPFQGPLACTRIGYGKGVCGKAWEEQKSFIVPDVDAFPGHIACSSQSRSEIVIPLVKNEKVWAVLDIDSDQLDTFDLVDQKYLEQVANLLSENYIG